MTEASPRPEEFGALLVLVKGSKSCFINKTKDGVELSFDVLPPGVMEMVLK